MTIQEQTQPRTRYTAQNIYEFSLQGQHYELLNGELFEMTPAKQDHGAVANMFAYWLTAFIIPNKLGVVYAAETGFTLPNGDVLAPDVSFTRKERIQPEGVGFSTVAPDLVVEVDSPSNTKIGMQEKVDAYFAAGVRQVWLVYHRPRKVYRYTSPTQVTIYQNGDWLDGGDVLPGFHVQVNDLFSVLDA